MSFLELPWHIPAVPGDSYRAGLLPTSTATIPVLAENDTSTAAYFSHLTSSGPVPPPPGPPRVGRPDRGKRSTVKAARRAARRK